MKYDTSKLTLPDGFDFTCHSHDRFFITNESFGIATIYPFKRNYALGGNNPCRDSTKYNGRGWLQKIVDDAVASLKGD
jgi:hypothetical protein